MRTILLALSIIFTSYLPVHKPTDPTNIREVWIVAGQSNADGRNDGLPSVAGGDGVVPGIQMYNYVSGNFADWDYGVNGGAFTNTSLSFAFDVFALTGYKAAKGISTLYVLKATRGGTAMSATANTTGSWNPNILAVNAHSSTQSKMAAQLKERIERVRIINARQGYVTKFMGVLWHQGEGDAAEPHASNYQSNMTDFIAAVRKWTWRSDLPFFAGTVPTNSTQYSATVRTGMANIALADPNYHLIDLGSRTMPDNVHWDAAESEDIGENSYLPEMLTVYP